MEYSAEGGPWARLFRTNINQVFHLANLHYLNTVNYSNFIHSMENIINNERENIDNTKIIVKLMLQLATFPLITVEYKRRVSLFWIYWIKLLFVFCIIYDVAVTCVHLFVNHRFRQSNRAKKCYKFMENMYLRGYPVYFSIV